MNRNLLAAGDHVVTPRRGYTHHGIYVGDDYVIHHSGFSSFLEKGPIIRSSLTDFCAGEECFVKTYTGEKSPPDVIVARALEMLEAGADYNLISRNCEHFATWCVTGEGYSEQVETAGLTGSLLWSNVGLTIGTVASVINPVVMCAYIFAKKWKRR